MSDQSFKLLDVGCGNHSPSITKSFFPFCQYYGIDKELYNNDQGDLKSMDKFFQLDLSQQQLAEVPEDYFDVIIFAHVIEHLENGYQVLESLTRKLKKKRHIYVEFPSPKSVNFPTMKKFGAEGCLNFYDDPTHVKLYSVDEVSSFLEKHGFAVERKGTYRNLAKLAALPAGMFLRMMGRFKGRAFIPIGLWDVFGFRNYVLAQKL